MFNYSSSETVIPTLSFTKAELIYAVSVLLEEIPDTDNSTRIEMVEVRHYLNQIKDKVSMALTDGAIGRAMAHSNEKSEEDTAKAVEPPEGPSMADLKRQFPNLSEEEIREVLERARIERRKLEEEKKRNAPPPLPTFIAKPIEDTEEPIMEPVMTPQERRNMENSRKFASMLGKT